MLVLAHFLDECARGECANAGAFLGGHFCAQFFRVCSTRMYQCWRIPWVVISVPKFSECVEGKCGNAGAFPGWLFLHRNF